MINRRELLAAPFAGSMLAAAPQKPNIILMMADDMGYADLGCFGSEIATPNLDRLARQGVRMTDFKNTARCCPTRASLLTGLYPHQAGIGHMMGDYGVPGYRGDLNRRCVTIGEVLKPAGYRTGVVGKWHVTPFNGKKHNWPLQRGFDSYYGTIIGAGNFFNPRALVSGNEVIEPSGDYYYTDALGENAAKFIGQSKSEPYFLYTAFTAPHWPMHAREEDIRKYQNRYKGGWDALCEERYQGMLKAGSIDKRWGRAPRDPEIPAWAEVPNKEWQARRMAVYAAMIDRLDQAVGRILKAVDESGQADNTLILFLADNGGCAEGMSRNPRAESGAALRDGTEVVHGNRPEVMPGPANTFQSYGPEWAHVSNVPFRMYKHWVHEGGISSPLIARWPARFKKTGGWSRQASHLIDLMATCVDASGAAYPKTYGGEAIQPMEGQSLVPALENPGRVRERTLYWEHEGNRAIRRGDWKLVAKHKGPWELYDLAADRTELKDKAGADPARAKRLEADWNAWAERAQVVAWDQLKRTP
jgi:arylsulfatase